MPAIQKISDAHYTLTDKGGRSVQHFIAMKDATPPAITNPLRWVYFKDGERHGRIPPIMMPDEWTMNLFGGLNKVLAAGYKPHWMVFEDMDTQDVYFGNYPCFSRSGREADREQAKTFVRVDIGTLM